MVRFQEYTFETVHSAIVFDVTGVIVLPSLSLRVVRGWDEMRILRSDDHHVCYCMKDRLVGWLILDRAPAG